MILVYVLVIMNIHNNQIAIIPNIATEQECKRLAEVMPEKHKKDCISYLTRIK